MQLMVKIRGSGNAALLDQIASEIEGLLRSRLPANEHGVSLFISSGRGKWDRAFGFGRNADGTDLELLVKQKADAYGVRL